MSHAARGTIGRRPRFSHDAHPGGGWKFGFVAVIATALAVTFVYSPLLRGTGPAAAPIVLGPAAPVVAGPITAEAPAQIRPPVLAIEPADVAAVPSAAQETTQPITAAPPAVKAQVRPGIRTLDFAALPLMQDLALKLGGRVDKTQIVFADLTGDGAEEAIVPLTSDGSYGNLAVVVFTNAGSEPQALLTRLAGRERRGLVVVFDRGQLTETSGVYGPLDPNCCPSQLVKTYFRWDGNNLVFDRTETITIPPGKQQN